MSGISHHLDIFIRIGYHLQLVEKQVFIALGHFVHCLFYLLIKVPGLDREIKGKEVKEIINFEVVRTRYVIEKP
jgi:hypothetical protein